VTVAPDQQALIASLDDGTQLEVVAKVASGGQSSLVLPIPASAQQRPGAPADAPPGGAPPPLPTASLAIGISLLAPGPDVTVLDESLASGLGLFALFERRVARPLGLVLRADYVWHPASDDFEVSYSGAELMLLAGLRTMTRTVHARLEAGVTILATTLDEGLGPASQTGAYPVIGLGGGLQLGRVRLGASLLYTANVDGGDYGVEIPLRFMGVLGVDLWRR
jgi:hypothetical protein